MCVQACARVWHTRREKRPGAHMHLGAWEGLPLSYLVVILQHLRDDSYLRVVVLYGDYSEKERTAAEAGCALPLESDGKIDVITSKRSECGASSQAHPQGLQALGQVKLCLHHDTP